MILVSLLLLAAQAAAPAVNPPLARVEAVALAGPVKPGAPVTLEVTVTPREGIHVYAPPQKRYIPVSLALEPLEGGRVGRAQFPASVERTFDGEKVRVYDKAFAVRVPVVVPASVRPAAVSGTLTYQACDDVMCYRPVKVPVRWDLRIQ